MARAAPDVVLVPDPGGARPPTAGLAAGASASQRAAAAVAPVARAGQRAPSPADGSRGIGQPGSHLDADTHSRRLESVG